MKIGVRAHDFGKMTIENMANLLKQKGYECTQLALPRAFTEIDSFHDIRTEHLERIRQTFKDRNIEIAVFSCYMDLSAPEKEVRKQSIETLKMCLAYSKEVGAKMVATETSCKMLSDYEKEAYTSYMFESIKEVMEEAAKLDVKLAIEPVHCHPLNNPLIVNELIKEIDDEKHLRFIFDPCNVISHDITEVTPEFLEVWLNTMGKYVDAMHLKNFSYGKNKEMLPTALETGIVDFSSILRWFCTNKSDIRLLREETITDFENMDIAFMKSFK